MFSILWARYKVNFAVYIYTHILNASIYISIVTLLPTITILQQAFYFFVNVIVILRWLCVIDRTLKLLVSSFSGFFLYF